MRHPRVRQLVPGRHIAHDSGRYLGVIIEVAAESKVWLRYEMPDGTIGLATRHEIVLCEAPS